MKLQLNSSRLLIPCLLEFVTCQPLNLDFFSLRFLVCNLCSQASRCNVLSMSSMLNSPTNLLTLIVFYFLIFFIWVELILRGLGALNNLNSSFILLVSLYLLGKVDSSFSLCWLLYSSLILSVSLSISLLPPTHTNTQTLSVSFALPVRNLKQHLSYSQNLT